MRMVRVYQFIFLGILLILDVVATSIFNQFGMTEMTFVSNMSLIGILLLARTDARETTLIKAFCLGLWIEMNHVGTFPIFLISYSLTFIIVRTWDRFVGTSTFETVVQVINTLFIKEVITFILMYFLMNYRVDFMSYVSNRIIWVVVLNLALLPIVLKLYNKMGQIIAKQSQDAVLK